MSGPAGISMVAGGRLAGRSHGLGSGLGGGVGGPAMLASVTNGDEAAMCLAAGVDVIDCKDPQSGALGALPLAVVAEICALVGGHVPVSATIGDLPCQSSHVVPAAAAMADTGCDIVKVGLLQGGLPEQVIADLGRTFADRRSSSRRVGLVGVLFADLKPDVVRLIPAMASAGFCGVMIDTADKRAGRLVDCLNPVDIKQFVDAAHNAGLFAGLAGSLRLSDVDELAALKPDILGFRGGLCVNGLRGFGLDEGALRAVRRAMGPGDAAGVSGNPAQGIRF